MIGDPISGAIPEGLWRGRGRRGWGHFEGSEALEGGHGLGTVSQDILPKSVYGLADSGEIWRCRGEGIDDNVFDLLEIVLELVDCR